MKKRLGSSPMLELIVYLIIIMSISATVYLNPDLTSIGRDSQNKAIVNTVASAVAQFKFETGDYPSQLNDLTIKKDIYGPYLLAENLKDTYAQPINYSFNAEQKKFMVWSNGKNKVSNSNIGTGTIAGDDVGIVIKQ